MVAVARAEFGVSGFGHVRRRVRQRLAERHADHCLLYTSDAADERSSVDLGGRRIIKKKNSEYYCKNMLTHATDTTSIHTTDK